MTPFGKQNTNTTETSSVSTESTQRAVAKVGRLLAVVLGCIVVTFTLSACSQTEKETDLVFSDVWSRQPAEGQKMTAVYAVVKNPTDSDITITAATTEVTDRVELHETITNAEGVMSMVERPEGFTIKAGSEFLFEPGGPHVMLFKIDPATYPESFEVTFKYGDKSSTHTAEVRAIPGGDHAHHDHGDHDHGDHDHGDHDEHKKDD